MNHNETRKPSARLQWPSIQWTHGLGRETRYERFQLDLSALPVFQSTDANNSKINAHTYAVISAQICHAVWNKLGVSADWHTKQVAQYLESQIVQHYRQRVGTQELEQCISTNLESIAVEVSQQMREHCYSQPVDLLPQIDWTELEIALSKPPRDFATTATAAKKRLAKILDDDLYQWFSPEPEQCRLEYWFDNHWQHHTPQIIILNSTQTILLDITSEAERFALQSQARSSGIQRWCAAASLSRPQLNWNYFEIPESTIHSAMRFSDFF